jgi:hypothetical protein
MTISIPFIIRYLLCEFMGAENEMGTQFAGNFRVQFSIITDKGLILYYKLIIG